MARTADEVARSLENSILQTDPSYDVNQGPIPDIFIRPVSGEISNAEEDAEELRQLFTLDFDEVITEEETQRALGNFGSSPGVGTKSTHIQYFMSFSRPQSDLVILAGTLVGNSEGNILYQVLETGVITANNADTFFNSSRGTYEIGLRVEALGVGDQYKLAAFRVNTLLTPIIGVEATENRTTSSGGTDEETVESQTNRLKTQLQGTNLSAPGGITKKIQDDFPGQALAVNIVKPGDEEFKRILEGPALDIYVIGNALEADTFSESAFANQTEIVLPTTPVVSVSDVRINSVSVPYSFVPDATVESGRSLNAVDRIVLEAPALAGDTIQVDYNYNSLLEQINTTTLSNNRDDFFNTDMLVRSPFEIGAVVELEIKLLPSYEESAVVNDVTSYLENKFTFTNFIEIIYPSEVRDEIRTTVSGIQSLRFLKFKRQSNALTDIEPMSFLKSEVAKFDSTLVNIRVLGA